MDEYENITEENINEYEEVDKEMPGKQEDFNFVETVTFEKID